MHAGKASWDVKLTASLILQRYSMTLMKRLWKEHTSCGSGTAGWCWKKNQLPSESCNPGWRSCPRCGAVRHCEWAGLSFKWDNCATRETMYSPELWGTRTILVSDLIYLFWLLLNLLVLRKDCSEVKPPSVHSVVCSKLSPLAESGWHLFINLIKPNGGTAMALHSAIPQPLVAGLLKSIGVSGSQTM